MYTKSLIFVGVLCVALIEARPKWQTLPEVPGYVPVYIRNGDTPLYEINPDLAEAFHALPIGRSVNKQVEASSDIELEPPQSVPDVIPIDDRRIYEKKLLDKKKKASYDILKPVERR